MLLSDRRGARAALYAALLVLLPGCEGEAVPGLEWEEHVGFHFEDGYLATTFGSTLVDVWAGGQVVGDPLVILPGSPTPVVATFHDAASNLVQGLDEYVLLVSPANPELLRFTLTGAFEGTLTRLAPGATILHLGLRNTERQLQDFGPFPVPVTVR